jgi:hypothetical protein
MSPSLNQIRHSNARGVNIIRFEICQCIEQPIEKVFAFVSDFTNMSLWNYYIQKVTKVSAGENGIGTRYLQQRPHDTNTYKVIQYEKPHRIAIELQPPKPLQQYGFELRAHEEHTNIVYKWEVNLEKYKLLRFIPNGNFKSWLLSFARKHVFNNIKPATEQNFLKLKKLLETGSVTLQDGRQTFLPHKFLPPQKG